MPAKQQQRAEINTFVQGLITEASPLNFPPNASKEEENFELNRDGSRNRRLGMDVEPFGVFRDSGLTAGNVQNAGISTFKWEEVSGNPMLEFLVVQFNNRIAFYDLNKESVSRDGYLGVVTISGFPANTKYSFASVEGVLVVVSGVDTFAIISYNANGSFSVTRDRIKIRDVFGVEDVGLYESDITYRGTSLYPRHYYNLHNQSWGIPRLTRYPTTDKQGTNERYTDPVWAYRSYYKKWPSNGESIWLAMQYTPAQYNPRYERMEEPREAVHVRMFEQSWGSEVAPAKGYFIIDALRRGQSRVEEYNKNLQKYPELNKWSDGSPLVSSMKLPSDYTPGGPTCVAEFAGRIFYSGFRGEVVDGDKRSPNYANYIFFSKLVRNKTDLNKCYQEGDPTGRDTSDLLDTDGGFLRVSEAKDIHTLINIGTGLLIIATNGVWSLDGGSDYGFSATNYKVEKISSFGGISSSTVVVENNRAFFWASDGIYTVGTNDLGDMTVDSISIGSIQSLFDEIPSLAKRNAETVYDPISKKVRWIFNTGDMFSGANEIKELVLDTTLNSFSLNRVMNIPGNTIGISGIFETTPYTTGAMQDVVMAGDELVVAEGEPVVVMENLLFSGLQATKYLTLRIVGNRIHYSFSSYNNIRFLDWESINGTGVDAKAFCLTGAQTIGDSAINKQIPYLTLHFLKTEDTVDSSFTPQNQSGCLFRGQWGFANSPVSGKWTPLMQGYRYRKPIFASSPLGVYDNGFEVITTKNKLRGIGKAFSLYFETEPGKDCRLLGWNITMTGNSVT